jgi:hypothetical protein
LDGLATYFTVFDVFLGVYGRIHAGNNFFVAIRTCIGMFYHIIPLKVVGGMSN